MFLSTWLVALAVSSQPVQSVSLTQGEVSQITLTAEVPMFAVVRWETDAGVVSDTLEGRYGFAMPPPEAKALDATLVVLKQPKRVTLRVTERDGGVEVTGAEVRRIALPGRFDTCSLKVPSPDVVLFTRSEGSGCPETSTTAAYLVRDGGLTSLMEVESTGEDGYHRGSSLFWGGEQTGLVAFPRADPKLVTVIQETVEADQLVCATRKRYRFTGAALKLVDVTHAPDAGCAR
ncbi:MAG: hypothetical protein ACO1OB_17585 [Archangium sp.]